MLPTIRRGSSKRYETSYRIVSIPTYYIRFIPHMFRSPDDSIAFFSYALSSASRVMDFMASMVALINSVSMALLAAIAMARKDTPGAQGIQGAAALLQLLVLCGELYRSLVSFILCDESDRSSIVNAQLVLTSFRECHLPVVKIHCTRRQCGVVRSTLSLRASYSTNCSEDA